MSNRRNWLKKVSLGIVGLGVGQLETFSNPITDNYDLNTVDFPILLRSNENPYGPSPLARVAMAESVNISNRYGWKTTSELISEIAKRNIVNSNNILTAAGSTEILDLVLLFAAHEKGSFIIANPTYDYWTYPSEKLGLSRISVPLDANKKYDLSAMLNAIKSDTRLIYICNPNNPTGTICKRDELVNFINEVPKKIIVLVDEAYIDFTRQQSLTNLVLENKNLIIAKTFSKMYGLAGARIGYAVAHETTINQISELISGSNSSFSVVSAAGALASLKDEGFKEKVYVLNEKVKKYTIDQLENLNITCIPSNSNFIYFSLLNYKKDFFAQLEKYNIQGTKIYEENGKWSRITMGTMQEMEMFIKALK